MSEDVTNIQVTSDETVLPVETMISSFFRYMDSLNLQMTKANVLSFNNIYRKVSGYTGINDSVKLQNAIDDCSRYGNTLLIDQILNINSTVNCMNIRINGTKDGYITSNLSCGNLPLTFLRLYDNVILDGVNFHIEKSNVDTSTKGKFITVAGSNIEIKNCNIENAFYGIYGFGGIYNKVNIHHNTIKCIRHEILLNNMVIHNLKIDDNEFPEQKNYSVPCEMSVSIMFSSGSIYPKTVDADVFNDITYTTKYSNNVSISRNKFFKINQRAIYAINCMNIFADNNVIDNEDGGDKDILGYSDDVIVLEFCRHFSIDNNVITASGENGIDVLSTKNGSISNNVINKCDDTNICIGNSDFALLGYTNLSPIHLVTENISVVGNTVDFYYNAIYIANGRNISMCSNILSKIGDRPTAYNLIIKLSDIFKNTGFLCSKIQCSGNITNLYGKTFFDGASMIPYLDENTIELDTALCVSTIVELSASQDTIKSWIHNCAKLKNHRFDLFIGRDVNNYTEADWLPLTDGIGMYDDYYDMGNKIKKGITSIGYDKWTLFYSTGKYLVNVPNQFSSIGNISNIIKRYVRISIW